MALRKYDNSFVMRRPKNETETLTVESLYSKQNKDELIELYEKSFMLLLDFDNNIKKKTHRRWCLNSVFPTIALVIFHELPDESDKIIEWFLSNASDNEINIFESYPDQESRLAYAMQLRLEKILIREKKSKDDNVDKDDAEFLLLLKKVYFDLPAVFVFNLVDIIGL